MNLHSMPDFAAMVILMGVLEKLRRRHRDSSVDLWMLGLTFILLEAVAVFVMRGFPVYSDIAHACALDAYVLAGVTFGWAACKTVPPGSFDSPVFFSSAVPLFALATLYGFDSGPNRAYLWIGAVSLIAGLAYLLMLDRPGDRSGESRSGWRFRLSTVAIHCAIWGPITWMALHGSHRLLVYWGLGWLYLLVALCFRKRVRDGNVGGIVIVAGFVLWALCFLAHPFVRDRPVWNDLDEQIWTMQKFFVVIGMLLVLLEDQTRRLSQEALQDPLTGLPNRRLFDDRLVQALSRVRRTGLSAAVFIIDLDNFKQINDNFGHRTGDIVLVQASQMLKSNIRSSDTLARCGGDEFNVIVNDLTRPEDCERIAAALRAALGSVDVPGENAVALSASIGYALFPDDVSDPIELCELADVRMYKEKRTKTTGAALRP